MAKLPRNLNGRDFVKLLQKVGYEVSHTSGSHIICLNQNGAMLSVPAHKPLKAGTLNALIRLVSEHLTLTKEQTLNQLFG
jgi:predicted RNA binding protein YcfA (HicA-like mRNA interferase family)